MPPHIIAGSAKGKRLLVTEGTRPVTGRIKQSIFGLLGFDDPNEDHTNQRVLDLFAGSGSYGLETLSRGVASAVFVEKGERAAQLLQQNIASTGFTSQAKVITRSVTSYLRDNQDQFDFIFIDPPFPEAEQFPLRLIAPALKPSGIAIFRMPSKAKLPEHLGLAIAHEEVYGESVVFFLKLA